MLTQLKFAWSDIREHPIAFFFSFVQILIALILIGKMSNGLSDLGAFKERIEYLENTKNTYMVIDNTDDEVFSEIIEDKNNGEKLFEIYSYFRNEADFKFYTCYFNYDMFNDDSREIMFIDEGFFDVHKLECVYDSSDIPFFTDVLSDYVPVILGYSYQDKYKIGDIIVSDSGCQYVVSNFLKKNSFYLNLKSDDSLLYLDVAFICPVKITADSYPSDIASVIERGYVITENEDLLSYVEEKALPLNISFRSLKTQIENIMEEKLFDIYTESMIMVLLSFLCITCMISSLLVFIENHMKEFSVHILSGATMTDIAQRVIIQAVGPILLAEFGAILFSNSTKSTMMSLLITVGLCVAVVVFPMIKIYRLEIREVLKRCE